MIAVVIPTSNEGDRLSQVLNNMLRLPFDFIIPVINGCHDNTLDIIKKYTDSRIHNIYFQEPLGIDIPRAIGAKRALDLGATAVIFIDGDMIGEFSSGILDIILALEDEKVDLALTNCYNFMEIKDPLAKKVLRFRERLNSFLNLQHLIGVSSPSHGPHGLSKKLIETIGYRAIATPPLILTLAKEHNFHIKVVTHIPHNQLKSAYKGNLHAEKIAETIIGDCLEAMSKYKNSFSSRSWGNEIYLGYHPDRRWDMLEDFIRSSDNNKKD